MKIGSRRSFTPNSGTKAFSANERSHANGTNLTSETISKEEEQEEEEQEQEEQEEERRPHHFTWIIILFHAGRQYIQSITLSSQ